MICWAPVAMAVLLLGCTPSPQEPTPVPTPEPTPTLPTAIMSDATVVPRFSSPAYGVQAFLWWKPHMERWSDGVVPRELEQINEMGFGWVKQQFAWRDIEGIEKGKYDWWRTDQIVSAVEAANLKLLVRIDRQPFWSQEPDSPLRENRPPADLQDFKEFCQAMASRYRGRIAAYQIWNEPNLSREWGQKPPSAIEYTALLGACSQGIREADPEAIVISAGLAPTGTDSAEAIPDAKFLQQMYDAGASAHFDVLGVHGPGYKAPPEISPNEAETTPEYGNGRWFAFRHVEDMRAIMVANGDAHKQVAILEMGWTLDQVNPEYAWFAVDEQTQAEYLVRAYQYAAEHWQPWIGLMTTVYLADSSWTPEGYEQWWWSIVLPDGTPRQAFYALRDMKKIE